MRPAIRSVDAGRSQSVAANHLEGLTAVTTADLSQFAERYLASGLCVLPAHRAQKRPAIKQRWEPFKSRLPTPAEIGAWFAHAHEGLCLVCGAVSGGLEVIDFDCAGELFEPWKARVEAASPGLFAKLVVESTPSSGWHVAYRSQAVVCGNLKLAQRKQTVTAEQIKHDNQGREVATLYGKRFALRTDPDGSKHVLLTLIETRGEGGLFLCAPTEGYRIIQGNLCELPVLTEAERDTLLRAAWELNEYIPPVVDAPVQPRPAAQRCADGAAASDKPGDDFNRRGDARGVLQRHGWVRVSGGANEYWRRPGKNCGWSATLKDGVFYVFSSSAEPFEPNRAYSPFAVYALLECGGDFERAARELRHRGYGSDALPSEYPDVDISGIVAAIGRGDGDGRDRSRDSAGTADPGPIPEGLFSVPGFISEVMDFTLANAPYPNIGLAFCGAVALQSFLCGRKVCDRGDLRPNIYLLALASSGTGKDFPRKVNARALMETGQVACLGDKFASGEGIQDALVRSNAMLFQNDEMDGVLRQINLDRENKRESIPNILLTLYTSAADVYPVRVKAGQKEAIHIDQPHVTLFGTATPQYFYESLSQRMLTNGFFARLIIVDVGKRGPGQKAGSARRLPDAVLDVARWWSEFQPGTRRANLLEVHPEPRVVPYSDEAEEVMAQLRRQAESEYDAAHEHNDEVARVAWSRTHENAKKLALLYACSANHEGPVVDAAAVAWASAFAMHQTRRQLYMAQVYVAENPFHANCLKVIRTLREAPQRKMGHSALLQRMHMKAADFRELMQTLEQRGEVHPVTTPRAGTHKLEYQTL